MIWAKTPFDLTDDSASWNPWIGDNVPDYPCPIVAEEKVCIDWERFNVDTPVASPWSDPNEPRIVVSWDDGRRPVAALPRPVGGLHKGIHFPGPQKTPTASVYVADQSSNDISTIDATTNQVRGPALPVGRWPFRIAITPDGSTIVVLNRGDATLVTIDAATHAIVGAPIPVRPEPAGLAIHPNGTRIYVTSYGSKFVCVVDLGLRRVIREIAMPDRPDAIAILPNGTKAYASIPPIVSLSVIDLATDTVSGAPIPTVQAMENLLVSPNGLLLYVPGSRRVAVLDTVRDHFLDLTFSVGEYPAALAITPDGSQLYVANAFDDTVSVIGLAASSGISTARADITTIPVGKRPLALAVAPNGTSVYVANNDSNDISIIDVATNRVTGSSIAVGVNPGAIAEPVMPRFGAAALGLLRGIRRVRIRGGGEWYLLRVCFSRPATPGGYDDVVSVRDQLGHSLSVWGEPGAVLEPFTDYRLSATVSRETVGLGALGGWHDTDPLVLKDRYFRTGGPPGLAGFSVPEGLDPGKSATGLEDLTRYVAQTVPSTLTPPGKLPELTRPVFRAYDIGATFDEDYVDRMYELAGRDLAVQIYDSRNLPERDIDGRLAVLANPWGNAAEVTLSETHQRWVEMVNAASCIPRDLDVTAFPKNKTLTAPDHILAGNTLYEARLVPLLLRAPVVGGAGWTTGTTPAGVPMLQPVPRNSDSPETWTDVLIVLRIQPAATAPAGIQFRLGAGGHYELVVDAQNGLLTLTGGSVAALSPFTYDVNQSYRFAIEAIGSRLRVEQDEAVIFDVEDASFTTGGLALFPWSGAANSHFLDLAVYDFRNGAPVAYRFSFTTSDYVDFFHQIQSFQDETWSAALGAGASLPSLMVRATDLSAPASQEEARAYDALAETLLGAAARQLPSRLEVTKVTQADVVPALLFRGSEPIDWRRTTLALLQAASSSLPAAVPRGNLKLTSVAFGDLQLGGDVVAVLLRDAADLTGYRIETLLAAAWVPWYVFDQERKRPAGTRFEVHGGTSPLPLAEPGVIPKAANAAGHGQRLPVDAAELRLVAPDGTIEHARRFLPFEAYTPIAVDVMRSADGTGFFLIPSSGSAFGAGTYRAALKYERDKMGVEPILSRAGSKAAESVIIDIPSWADTVPAIGQPSFLQSTFGTSGNFEGVTPRAAGGMAHIERDKQTLEWTQSTTFADRVGTVSDGSLIRGSFGNLEVVARIGDQLAPFWRNAATLDCSAADFFAAGVSGTPSFIQGRFGTPGNFEVVAPLAIGGMAHFYRNNADPLLPW